MEIFANINTIFQISSVPYFADFVSLRSLTKDLKQNCLFAACFSRQNHYSVLVRNIIIFSLQNTYKNYKGKLKIHLIHNNSNPHQLHNRQFSLILNNLNFIILFANCCRLNKILQMLRHCFRIYIPK